MPSIANSALRALRRILGTGAPGPAPQAGSAVILDGNTALAAAETAISETAALGGSFPADGADLAWLTEQRRLRRNVAGSPLSSLGGRGARGTLAAAMGLSMSGVRATSFFSGPDLAGCQDLLTTTAARRLPLVIHLAGRALDGPGSFLGNGHESFHACAATGCFLLVATSVQEASDFAMIARRTAEYALLPGIVALDGEQTALALQDVRLPTPALISDFLGDPDEPITSPGEVQKLLFGDTRRRIPRWHDPDHPTMIGALTPTEAAAPGRAAARAFLDPDLESTLDDAFARFGALAGRRHTPLSTYRTADARLVLVAMGSAVETAENIADHMRTAHHQKVGVLGIRCLSPFPASAIANVLARGPRVCVLESADAPVSQDPPLMRLVRAAIDRAAENARFGGDAHPDFPKIEEQRRPRLLSVIYGLGGVPLRAADLVLLCQRADLSQRSRVYLGIDFAPSASVFPKRQVLLDRLRRSHPEIARLGLRADVEAQDTRTAGAFTLAIHRYSGMSAEGLCAEMAALLQRIGGERIRGRPGLFTRPWGDLCVDRITSGPLDLREPGEDAPVELALLLGDQELSATAMETGLSRAAALLVQSVLPDESLWARLPPAVRARVKGGDARLYRMAPPTEHPPRVDDYVLGAVCGLLLRRGLVDLSRRRLVAAREAMLSQSTADFAQHLRRFESGMEAAREVATSGLVQFPTGSVAGVDDEAPALVRRTGSAREAYDNLPRFWDQVGVLYRTGDARELAPEPHLAVAAIPPLTSGFRDLSSLRERVPQLDPARCTGCAACWSACPEGAIGAVAATPSRLIDVGIHRAGADALRPLAAKLAASINSQCREPPLPETTLGGLIRRAYRNLEEKLPFPDERKVTLQDALQALISGIGCLPVAVTAPFFSRPDASGEGGGALLCLSLSPETCKGCGMCVEACEDGALQITRQGHDSPAWIRQVREVWEALPETDAGILQTARSDIGDLGAELLRHGAPSSMAGGDGSEPGSGARLALRLLLATLEARQVPRMAAFRQEVEESRSKIAALIRDLLADALPAHDFDALAEKLEAVDARQADLTAFIGEAGGAIEGVVDAARLRRLVGLARGLGDLAWRLEIGAHGLGRARAGLVLSPGSPVGWAGAFPDNPFPQPVVLDWTGDGAQVAAGLLEGQLRQAILGLVLLRKARLELERPADAARLWSDLDSLTWRDLEPRERSLCPSLFLVGDSGSLGGRGLSGLVQILSEDLPLRVILLADLDLGLGRPAGLDLPLAPTTDSVIDLALLALSVRGAYVAQSCTAVPEHLARSLEGVFGHLGPALLHLHAPSPARHGFPPERTLERAKAAVNARVFPLFRYDPGAEGVFGSRLGLDGNPAPRELWDQGREGVVPTPAHWALGEERFAHLFAPLAKDAPEPTDLAAYLDLPESARHRCTPFIEAVCEGSETRRFRVDERLAGVCAQRGQAWRMLQELAGLVTPFTARVQQEAEERVAAAHQTELRAREEDAQRQLQALHAEYQAELRQQIRARLMRLAGYDASVENRATGEESG